jgi:hypothetical protein
MIRMVSKNRGEKMHTVDMQRHQVLSPDLSDEFFTGYLECMLRNHVVDATTGLEMTLQDPVETTYVSLYMLDVLRSSRRVMLDEIMQWVAGHHSEAMWLASHMKGRSEAEQWYALGYALADARNYAQPGFWTPETDALGVASNQAARGELGMSKLHRQAIKGKMTVL